MSTTPILEKRPQEWRLRSLSKEKIPQLFDLRPARIIARFGLKNPIYAPTAAYGHVGREDLDLTWEKTDRIDELKAAVL